MNPETMRDLNKLKAKVDKRNATLNSWAPTFDMAMTLNVNEPETLASRCAAYTAGERRTHMRIRIPVKLALWYLRLTGRI